MNKEVDKVVKSMCRNRWGKEMGLCIGYDSTVAPNFTNEQRHKKY